MQKEIMGVSLERLQEPIKEALKTYQNISNNGLVFDADEAGKLNLTPDKPNSARSETAATFKGEKIGSLYVIAFKPGDGTGSEAPVRQLKDLVVEPPYPRASLVVPRIKSGVWCEAHLTIVSQRAEDVHAEPQLYNGRFDLLGMEGNTVRKIGELGNPIAQEIGVPAATFTVGYRPVPGYREMERFGDPHAVYSAVPDSIQVCAFLAISDEVSRKFYTILNGLNPKYPNK